MDQQTNKGVILATIAGATLVLIAVTASNWVPYLNHSSGTTADTVTAAPPERHTTADGDELAWQRSILDTSSTNPRIATTETADTPRRDPTATLTGRFGMALFEEALMTEQEGRSDSERAAAIARIVDEVMRETRGEMYTLDDITVVAATDEAIATYFNQAASIIIGQNGDSAEGEIALYERAVRTGDASAFAALAQKAAQYAELRDAYLELDVPTRVYKTHLNMVNVFHILHLGLADMAAAEEDPLRAYVRLERYPDDIDGLNFALISMGMHVIEYEHVFSTTAEAAYFLTYLPSLSSN